MIALVIAGVVLFAGSAWYLARPLAGVATVSGGEELFQLQQVRDRLIAQLNELDSEARDRSMDVATVEDERARLEVELARTLHQLDTFKSAAAPASESAPARRVWLMAMVVMGASLAVGGGGLYYYNQRDLLSFLANGEARSSVPPQALQMVARLEKKLAETPGDGAGWARLGRAYVVMGRSDDAKAAYAKAIKLLPDSAEALSEYGWLLYNEDPANTQGEVFTVYQRLFALQPDNQDALWFLGLAAYQKNDSKTALKHWERLLKSIPAESPTADHLRNVIAKARAKKL
jgi:cytochrome c-type biogenesis protein CcmH